MGKYIKKFSQTLTLTSIGLIIIGVLLVLKPASTLTLISYVLGGICLFIGTTNIIKYCTNKEKDLMDFSLVIAIISIISGFVFIFVPEFIASIVPIILGIVIISKSIVRLQFSLNLRRYQNTTWLRSFVISLIGLIFGIILFFNPFKGAVIMTQIIGGVMIIYAISDIIEFRSMNKVLDDGVEFIK